MKWRHRERPGRDGGAAGSVSLATRHASANLGEPIDRMGHSTTRATMAYLHGSDEQQVIACELSGPAADAVTGPDQGPNRRALGAIATDGIISTGERLFTH
jgi:hypothetical protein